MGDIRYVDADDPWEDEQVKKDKVNLSGIEDLELLAKVRAATGRKATSNFASPKEKNRYRLIDKQYRKGTIPSGWIDNCLDWAKSKNKQRIVIMFPSLTSLILNKARMQDWINKQPKNEVALEKYLDEDAFD